ncbi:hypothetical protein [Kaistella polysaccharea]|uniref:hypothetical protein n=1 Tax=Kaistella polysaccharea TaxID=2878534 RepID=UPI001CF46551|nr:hypothetical protein [Kaistella polysaccharea]
MKVLNFALFFLFILTFSQAKTNVGIFENLAGTKDLFADDYGNIYLYKSSNFSLAKYDSLGILKAEFMLTLPFKIQSVQNPLNIPSFSENAQEVKFFDKNLAEIQTIRLQQKFGYIKAAYAEDLQQLWLLDGSSKNLIQYHFREDKILNKFPLYMDVEDVLDLIVHEKQIYLLYKDKLAVYNFRSEKVVEIPVENARKLRRENDNILIISKNVISQLEGNQLRPLFRCTDCQIVDKNSSSYFEMRDNKLYLYPLEKRWSKAQEKK